MVEAQLISHYWRPGIATHARYAKPPKFRKKVSCLYCCATFHRAVQLERHFECMATPLWIRALKKRYKNRGGFRLLVGMP